MTEVAGLVVGVLAAWKSCVQVFGIVDSGRRHGMDYEILCIKLEVERIRLLTWGEAVGLDQVQQDLSGRDPRLKRPEINAIVLRLLAAIEHIFHNSESLQGSYGLRRLDIPPQQLENGNNPFPTPQLILGEIFTKAGNTLRRLAKDRQRETSLSKKAVWAVHDGKQFQTMVSEIKSFIDSLESLFPTATRVGLADIRTDIDHSDDVGALQSLQEATSDDHGEISDSASVRLEKLGGSSVAWSRVSPNSPKPTKVPESPPDDRRFATDAPLKKSELIDPDKQMQAVNLLIENKVYGALVVHQHHGRLFTPPITARVSRKGQDISSLCPLGMLRYTDVKNSLHPSFGLYAKRQFSRRNYIEEWAVEDDLLLCAESEIDYESANCGTTTVAGFGMQCKEFERPLHKQWRTTQVSQSKFKPVSAQRLLGRLSELRDAKGPISGWPIGLGGACAEEIFGEIGVWVERGTEDRFWDPTGFYRQLNRKDVFVDLGSNLTIPHQQAKKTVALCAKALVMDPRNAVYSVDLAIALYRQGKYKDASMCAWAATRLDSQNSAAWARLGATELKFGRGQRAKDAFQKAIELAGDEASDLIRTGLADAEAHLLAEKSAIETETDMEKQIKLHRSFRDKKWDIAGKTIEFHSRVHEEQVKGLLIFAERMKWPFINQVRDFAENVYSDFRSGKRIPSHICDWLFGVTLPGRYMSLTIMAALIHCTPSISARWEMPFLGNVNFGVILPKQSYWRVPAVLGRVLGCLPGVYSLCGWIGPCPPVDPLSTGDEVGAGLSVFVDSHRIAPSASIGDPLAIVASTSRENLLGATRPQDDEEPIAYMAEMNCRSNWVIPPAPVQQSIACTIRSICLERLPLDTDLVAKKARQKLHDSEFRTKTKYRASIVFTVDEIEDPIRYTLYTNPVFVTLPPCHSNSEVWKESEHEVHVRELPRFQMAVWTIKKLKNHTAGNEDEDPMVISVAGPSAEALARAWCAERGKSAVIRREGGPCFVCAVRMASQSGLGVGVLIWVS